MLAQRALVEKHREEGKKAPEQLPAQLNADHEKELEKIHRELQAQLDVLCKQAFQREISLTKKRWGSARDVGLCLVLQLWVRLLVVETEVLVRMAKKRRKMLPGLRGVARVRLCILVVFYFYFLKLNSCETFAAFDFI